MASEDLSDLLDCINELRAFRDPNEDRIFCKMIQKPYYGRVPFGHLSKMAPDDFPEETSDVEKIWWFNDHSNKFAKFEGDNGRVVMFGVRIRGAKLCMDYLGKRNNVAKTCKNADCRFFHVCQKFIGGFCRGMDCDFDHSFQSEDNRKVVRQLNLDKFGDDDLRRIVSQSQLQVCNFYNKDNSSCHHEDKCTKLHICADMVRGICTKEPCPKNLSHRFGTDHSSRLLEIYGMERNDVPSKDVLDQLLIIESGFNSLTRPRIGNHEDMKNFLRKLISELNSSEVEDKTHGAEAAAASAVSVHLDSDSDEDEAVCDDLLDDCANLKAVNTTWQVEIFGDWVSLNSRSSTKIEEAYCNPENETITIKMPDVMTEHFPDDRNLKINFTKMIGELPDEVQEVKIRRGPSKEDEDELFLWYYQEKNWIPYSAEDQFILETNYKEGAKRAFVGPDEIYRVKFPDSTQKNRNTGKIRKVCRRPILIGF